MLFATLPLNVARHFMDLGILKNELRYDHQAAYVPNGLRVVEAILLQHYSPSDIAVCYIDQLEQFVGDDTRVVGLHAHNPMGITFATDVYTHLAGFKNEPINATEFRDLALHPALLKHKQHLKVLAGGPGAWQIVHRGAQDELGIDCIVLGEAEDHILNLFLAAERGEVLPRTIDCENPSTERIPTTRHRSTFGVVEITRGCGRGCHFCSVATRRGRSIPLDQIVENVKVNVAEGADTIMLTTEDLFLYEQGPRFAVNRPALKRLYQAVASVPGVKHIHQAHATIAPIVLEPSILDDINPYALDMSHRRHPASTHPEERYASLIIGLETGSPRLFRKFMPAKAYPFRPEQWPDVVLKGMDLLNRKNWFPFCTWILGLPGETAADTKEALDLLHALKGAKWTVVPTLFTPLDETRLGNEKRSKLPNLTDLQWEFFFTCWRYNLDFFRHNRKFKTFIMGTPIYYYLLGRKLFGEKIKYPLWRLAHFPESIVSRRLYLNLDQPCARFTVPEHVQVTAHGAAHPESLPIHSSSVLDTQAAPCD